MSKKSALHPSDHLIPNARVTGDWVGDEDFIVIELNSGRYFGLGHVGGYLWERLVDGKDIQELAEELGRDFAISKDQAIQDTLEFAEQLISLDLASLVRDV